MINPIKNTVKNTIDLLITGFTSIIKQVITPPQAGNIIIKNDESTISNLSEPLLTEPLLTKN